MVCSLGSFLKFFTRNTLVAWWSVRLNICEFYRFLSWEILNFEHFFELRVKVNLTFWDQTRRSYSFQRQKYAFNALVTFSTTFFLKQSSQMSQDHRFDLTGVKKKYTLLIISHHTDMEDYFRPIDKPSRDYLPYGSPIPACICILQCFQCCSHQVMVKLLILCNL